MFFDRSEVMIWKTRIINGVTLLGILTTTTAAYSADDTVELYHGRFSLTAIEAPKQQPVLLSERFAFAFDRRADDVFLDRLHLLHMMKWSLQLNGSEDFRDRTTSAAQGAFTKSIAYSARDAIADSPFMVWLEQRQETLATFLRDSINSVEEESVSPLDASYGFVERSWWKGLRKSGAIRYGLRPFRSSPYAFTSFAVRDENEVFFLSHIRYYYDDLSEHRFEVAMSVPMAHGFALDVGTSYEFGRHRGEERLAIKIVRELRNGGIAHLGFELRERPILLAGITMLW
jgi:hypothetical protein